MRLFSGLLSRTEEPLRLLGLRLLVDFVPLLHEGADPAGGTLSRGLWHLQKHCSGASMQWYMADV